MIRRTGLWILLLTLGGVLAAPAQEPLRKQVVMYKGQVLSYVAAAPLITIQSPPSLKAETARLLSVHFDQYGQNVVLKGNREGYTKLLLEKTDSTIGEVLHVVVTDRKTWDRYRNVVAEISGIEGLNEEDVMVAGREVLITGNTWGTADEERCLKTAGSLPSKGTRVACAAHLSHAAPVIHPDRGWTARPAASLRESWQSLSGGDTRGMESESRWTLRLFLGDVPVIALESGDRADLISRAVSYCGQMNDAIAEWSRDGARRKVYFPGTFQSRKTGSSWEIRMQWKFDQGTRGGLLVPVTAEQMQGAGAAESPERLVRWWVALLQDSFRLYYLAQRPAETLDGDGSGPLVELYEQALKVNPEFNRESAPVALARAAFALDATTGNPLFESLLTQPPAHFAGEEGE